MLVKKFVDIVQVVGDPARVAGVTYTRAAAAEFRGRAAHALGIQGNDADLRKRMPYVGTVHSLAYRLAGHPKLVGKEIAEFLGTSGDVAGATDDGSLANWDPYDGRPKEAEAAVRAYNLACQRMEPIEDVIDDLPAHIFDVTTPARLIELADQYVQWKRERNLQDYDDLLEGGRYHELPVQALVCDEAQDNSRLLWSVLDAWTQRLPLSIFVGDPYQALYKYSGASPQEFLTRPGRWHVLPHSHRLSAESAAYAQRLLKLGGWHDPKIDQWRGVGSGAPTEGGTTLHLGRTHSIVEDVIEKDLLSRGVPFARLNSSGPLQSRPADLYRALTRLERGETIPAAVLADSFQRASRSLRDPLLKRAHAYTKQIADADYPVGARDVELAANTPLKLLKRALPWSDYLERIAAREGIEALFATPSHRVGTIHGAKGREADHVELVESWGWLPGQALGSTEGARDEALCAYVGASRHRATFTLVPAFAGVPYAFP